MDSRPKRPALPPPPPMEAAIAPASAAANVVTAAATSRARRVGVEDGARLSVPSSSSERNDNNNDNNVVVANGNPAVLTRIMLSAMIINELGEKNAETNNNNNNSSNSRSSSSSSLGRPKPDSGNKESGRNPSSVRREEGSSSPFAAAPSNKDSATVLPPSSPSSIIDEDWDKYEDKDHHIDFFIKLLQKADNNRAMLLERVMKQTVFLSRMQLSREDTRKLMELIVPEAYRGENSGVADSDVDLLIKFRSKLTGQTFENFTRELNWIIDSLPSRQRLRALEVQRKFNNSNNSGAGSKKDSSNKSSSGRNSSPSRSDSRTFPGADKLTSLGGLLLPSSSSSVDDSRRKLPERRVEEEERAANPRHPSLSKSSSSLPRDSRYREEDDASRSRSSNSRSNSSSSMRNRYDERDDERGYKERSRDRGDERDDRIRPGDNRHEDDNYSDGRRQDRREDFDDRDRKSQRSNERSIEREAFKRSSESIGRDGGSWRNENSNNISREGNASRSSRDDAVPGVNIRRENGDASNERSDRNSNTQRKERSEEGSNNNNSECEKVQGNSENSNFGVPLKSILAVASRVESSDVKRDPSFNRLGESTEKIKGLRELMLQRSRAGGEIEDASLLSLLSRSRTGVKAEDTILTTAVKKEDVQTGPSPQEQKRRDKTDEYDPRFGGEDDDYPPAADSTAPKQENADENDADKSERELPMDDSAAPPDSPRSKSSASSIASSSSERNSSLQTQHKSGPDSASYHSRLKMLLTSAPWDRISPKKEGVESKTGEGNNIPTCAVVVKTEPLSSPSSSATAAEAGGALAAKQEAVEEEKESEKPLPDTNVAPAGSSSEDSQQEEKRNFDSNVNLVETKIQEQEQEQQQQQQQQLLPDTPKDSVRKTEEVVVKKEETKTAVFEEERNRPQSKEVDVKPPPPPPTVPSKTPTPLSTGSTTPSSNITATTATAAAGGGGGGSSFVSWMYGFYPILAVRGEAWKWVEYLKRAISSGPMIVPKLSAMHGWNYSALHGELSILAQLLDAKRIPLDVVNVLFPFYAALDLRSRFQLEPLHTGINATECVRRFLFLAAGACKRHPCMIRSDIPEEVQHRIFSFYRTNRVRYILNAARDDKELENSWYPVQTVPVDLKDLSTDIIPLDSPDDESVYLLELPMLDTRTWDDDKSIQVIFAARFLERAWQREVYRIVSLTVNKAARVVSADASGAGNNNNNNKDGSPNNFDAFDKACLSVAPQVLQKIVEHDLASEKELMEKANPSSNLKKRRHPEKRSRNPPPSSSSSFASCAPAAADDDGGVGSNNDNNGAVTVTPEMQLAVNYAVLATKSFFDGNQKGEKSSPHPRENAKFRDYASAAATMMEGAIRAKENEKLEWRKEAQSNNNRRNSNIVQKRKKKRLEPSDEERMKREILMTFSSSYNLDTISSSSDEEEEDDGESFNAVAPAGSRPPENDDESDQRAAGEDAEEDSPYAMMLDEDEDTGSSQPSYVPCQPPISVSNLELIEGIEATMFPPAALVVHCAGGVNRTPLCVVYWLCRFRGFSLDEAWNYVTTSRGFNMRSSDPNKASTILRDKDDWRANLEAILAKEKDMLSINNRNSPEVRWMEDAAKARSEFINLVNSNQLLAWI